MKRINLCSNMKQHSITTGTKKTEMNGYDFKNPWDTNGGDQAQDFAAWPPRFYTCSFCKREFRSAQALGGHMNVHRRDRARLRQLSPPTFCISNNNNNNSNGLLSLLNPNPEPYPTNKNPYPNSDPGFFQSPTSSLSSHFTRLPIPVENLVGPLIGRDSMGMRSKKEGVMGVQKFDSIFMHGKGCEVVKKEELVRLDLEIGLSSTTHSKEDLDLELRLGCA